VESIGASVGIHSGKQCYNVVSDQETVRRLLNEIPVSQGGAGGALADPIMWGVVSNSLYQAILKFQRHNKLSVDGHIDPRGSAMDLMNRLTSPVGSESVGGDPEAGQETRSTMPKCGPPRTVKSGFLPDRVDVMGGPTGRFKFFGLAAGATVTIEAEIVSPIGIKGVKTFTVSTAKTGGPLWDVGMAPPVHWLINVRAAGFAKVRYEFLTDWSPGDPPCYGTTD
jgi:hypothetical protein